MSFSTRSRAARAALLGLLLVACATAPDDVEGTASPGTDAPPKPDKGLGGDEAGTTEDPGTAPLGGDYDAGVMKDASKDAKADAKHDASADSGGKGDAGQAGGICSAASVPSFMPTWHGPKVELLKCTPADIDAFFTACLETSATPATCSANAMAHAGCYDCLISESTDATWGALVMWPNDGPLDINVAGCIEHKSATDDACAKAYEGAQECEHLACDASCKTATMAEYETCVVDGDTGSCATLSDARATACTTLSPATAPCTAGMTFEERFKSIAKVFCNF